MQVCNHYKCGDDLPPKRLKPIKLNFLGLVIWQKAKRNKTRYNCLLKVPYGCLQFRNFIICILHRTCFDQLITICKLF